MRIGFTNLTGLAVLFLLAACGLRAQAADRIELLSGMKLDGEVTKEDADSVTFNSNGAHMTFEKKKIHVLVVKGERRVLNAKAASAPKPAPKPVRNEAPVEPAPAAAEPVKDPAPAVPANAATQRSRSEIQALIQKAGTSPPNWWDQEKLNYPTTLDLSWAKPTGGWNNRKNVGQYMWDIVNPNPNHWKSGAKLMHHIMKVNPNNKVAVDHAVGSLGHIYHDLLLDYPRAAFWMQKKGTVNAHLANCYWHMGNKDMAVEVMKGLGQDTSRHGSIIKQWMDMGEYDTALNLAKQKVASKADIAYLCAGDICRLTGRYQEALNYYQQVMQVSKGGRDLKQTKSRAQANIDAIKAFELLDLKRVPDGTYSDSSFSYSGPLTVAVTAKGGRIEDVKVTKHQDKQFYGAMTETPAKIIEKQHVKGVDCFSSATITSAAIINATAKALSKAMK